MITENGESATDDLRRAVANPNFWKLTISQRAMIAARAANLRRGSNQHRSIFRVDETNLDGPIGPSSTDSSKKQAQIQESVSKMMAEESEVTND